MKFKSLCFLMLASITAKAPLADPHHEGLVSSINLGIRYSSVLASRGVIFYRNFQIDPVVGLFFFDDRLEFLGDSIGYRDFVWGDKLRLRSKFNAISDDPLFPSSKTYRQQFPDRGNSYEWTNRAELFLPGYNDNYRAEIDLSHSYDFTSHHGQYVEATVKTRLLRFTPLSDGPLLEPNFVAALGWGNGRHNAYFYGPTANQAGFNNFSLGLWLALPNDADRFYPIVQLTYFRTIGDQNRSASFASGRSQGLLFSFIATYGVLE
jgi:hypothetical protein